MREMQLIELKQSIEAAISEDEGFVQGGAVVGEFKAAKIAFVSRDLFQNANGSLSLDMLRGKL
jgi:hypothetical protein